MKIRIPYTTYDVVGHRQGADAAYADPAQPLTRIEKVADRMPLKIRQRPAWTFLTPLQIKSACDGILKWQSEGPDNERPDRKTIADEFIGCWNGRHKCINIDDCEAVSSIPPIPHNVRGLSLKNFPNLDFLPDLSSCTYLTRLEFDGCQKVTTLPNLSNLKRLLNLILHDMPLLNIAPLELSQLSKKCSVSLPRELFADEVRSGLSRGRSLSNNGADESFYRNISFTSIDVPAFSLPNDCFRNQGVINRWVAFNEESNAWQFLNFLGRLKKGDHSYEEDDRFRGLEYERIYNFTDLLVEDAALRRKCFDAAGTHEYEGTESDMRLLMNLEQICAKNVLENEVKKGLFDQEPNTVVMACRGQFRMKVLEHAASEIRKDLIRKAGSSWTGGVKSEEEIQIKLIVRFKREFYLPCSEYTKAFREPLFYSKRGKPAVRRKLINENLSFAGKEKNDQEFSHFLAHSTAMCELLTRLDPQAMIQAQSEIILRMEKDQENIHRQINQLDSSSETYEDYLNELNLQLDVVADTATVEVRCNLMAKHGIDASL